MKKNILFVVLLVASAIGFYFCNNFKKEPEACLNLVQKCECLGDEVFNQNVEACLAIMEATAEKYSGKGVAVMAFVPGAKTEYWNSRMKVVGRLSSKQHNFLAVASAKATEMALTLQNSGTVSRQPLIGELGYKGGVIKKVACGYLIASFSGAPAEIDAEISKIGVDFLSKFFESH
ncbi:hypothetical protein [Algibacter sp. L3A6]|uniref:hypothetical protein n=1 Tax=Algibacter sp. L3A6 TaxID=2686366 RepID=UPI00131E8055|nr:hypothetical protein [Algibacter sp. L3A6]